MKIFYSPVLTAIALTGCATNAVNEASDVEIISTRSATGDCEMLAVVSGQAQRGYDAMGAVNSARRNAAGLGANAILITSSRIGEFGAISVSADALRCGASG